MRCACAAGAGGDQRQRHLLDAAGRGAAHTGTACIALRRHGDDDHAGLDLRVDDHADRYAKGKGSTP